MMPKQILHDAHKEHPLVLRDTTTFMGGLLFRGGFRCNGCACSVIGSRYRCQACDFDLHEFCATCPPTATFSFHGLHPLTFEPAVFPEDPRCCDLCDTPIRGMHYRCRPCGFDVHPICSQLPGAAISPLHPAHFVMLTVGKPDRCSHCHGKCLWRYRCNPCKVNLHPKCLLGTGQTPLGIPKDS